jgi:translation initiation factor 1
MSSRSSRSRLVYSTERGQIADTGADKPRKSGRRKKDKAPSVPSVPDDGVVRLSRSSKGRKGKGVTLITGIPLKGDALKELARELKQKCGSGGTLRGDVVEIQGDHRDALLAEITKRGYTVKKAGG